MDIHASANFFPPDNSNIDKRSLSQLDADATRSDIKVQRNPTQNQLLDELRSDEKRSEEIVDPEL